MSDYRVSLMPAILDLEHARECHPIVPLLRVREESDQALAGRIAHALGVTRVRAIALDAWRCDAARLSVGSPWPIPIRFSVEPDTLTRDVHLGCILETRDARSEEALPVGIQHGTITVLSTPRAERIRKLVELARSAVLHEFDECLLLDGQCAHDPHDPDRCHPPWPPTKALSNPRAPALDVNPRRKASLAISIGRWFTDEVIADEVLAQGDEESDPDFATRAVRVLGALATSLGMSPQAQASDTQAPATSAEMGTEICREHLDRLEILARASDDREADPVFAGLLLAYGFHGALHRDLRSALEAFRPGTTLREILRQRAFLETPLEAEALQALLTLLDRASAALPAYSPQQCVPRGEAADWILDP